ncbi:MAG: hypothetical protein EOP40_21625 [Rubrivivax sp.]|nr:MAG: hypothetical protein EOP40_21625 [Rubrivivax sp.]
MHAVLAFSALPLFLGALLSDWAYSSSYQVQWLNFASWLMAGGLLLAGLALAWAAVSVLRTRAPGHRGGVAYLLLLLATFVVGCFNALVHARDGWATMPTGLLLSGVVLVLAAVASMMGLVALRRRAVP